LELLIFTSKLHQGCGQSWWNNNQMASCCCD